MKIFNSFFYYFVAFVVTGVLFHWLYQVVWAWERFWQGALLFSVLSIAAVYHVNLNEFFSNKITLGGKLYKDQNLFFKMKWFLSILIAFVGVLFLLLIFWSDTGTSGVGYDWIDWSIFIFVYFLSLVPISMNNSKLAKEKREIKLKQEEEKEKHKKAKQERERLKKKLEEEKLQKEVEAKKAEAKEFLESLKLKHLNQIEKLNKNKEKLEASIQNEKVIINELNNKYPFIGIIVPNRIY